SLFYRRRFEQAGLRPDEHFTLDTLRRLPPVTKQELQEAAAAGELNTRDPAIGRLATEYSSGSTGTPFAIQVDRAYKVNRNLRFLRGLYAAGYRWPMRM